MKNPSVEQWEKVRENPTEIYKKAFIFEKDFLIKNTPKNSILLDIGCGSGDYIKYLTKISKEIFGIDNDENAIKKCNNNLKSFNNVKIVFADAEKIPFNDNSFDVAICMGNTFGNFDKTRLKVLYEIKRVLKDKGIFLFSVYNNTSIKERMIIYKKYWKEVIDKGNGKIIVDGVISEQFSELEIKDILDKADFKILDIMREKIFYLIKAQVNKK